MTEPIATESKFSGVPFLRWGSMLSHLLDKIAQGQVFRLVVGAVVQILAVLLLIGYVIFAFKQLYNIFVGDHGSPLPFSVGLGAIIAFVFGLVAITACCLVAWIRGGDIRRMHDQDFTVMAICARLFRMTGEIMLVLFLVVGVLALLLTWFNTLGLLQAFSLNSPWMPLSYAHIGNRFFGGIILMVGIWVYGFVTLLFNYLIAEFISVLFTIADETRRIRQASESR